MKNDFAGLSWRAAFRLAMVGTRTDRLRRVLTGAASGLVAWVLLLTHLTASIDASKGPYASDLLNLPSMRPAVIAGLVGFALLLMTLLAQCARIGGPDRDRRLAAFRLAGASPSDIARIVAADSFTSASVGTAVGLIVAQALKSPLSEVLTQQGSYTVEERVGPDSVRSEVVQGTVHLLPLDVATPIVGALVVLVAIPVGVAVFSQAAQWRVLTGPFAVANRATNRAAPRRPLIMFATGMGGLVAFSAARSAFGITADQSSAQAFSVAALALLATAGMLLGTAPIAQTIGQIAAARTRRPSLLIAGRRLAANPYTASRVNAVLLAVAAVAGFVLGLDEYLRVVMSTEDTAYLETLYVVRIALITAFGIAALGVLVASSESAVASRKALSALIATGVPRRTLRTSLTLEALLPLLVMLPIAVTAGIIGARGVLGTSDSKSLGSVANETILIIPVPVPWERGVIAVLIAWSMAWLVAWAASAFVEAAAQPSELRTMA